jgi:hypothetical protein
VTELLLGVRRALFLSGALSTAAAAALLVQLGGDTLEAVWWALTGVAWAVALILVLSFLLPRGGGSGTKSEG